MWRVTPCDSSFVFLALKLFAKCGMHGSVLAQQRTHFTAAAKKTAPVLLTCPSKQRAGLEEKKVWPEVAVAAKHTLTPNSFITLTFGTRWWKDVLILSSEAPLIRFSFFDEMVTSIVLYFVAKWFNFLS